MLVYRILLAVSALLVCVLIAGTLWGLSGTRPAPKTGASPAAAAPEAGGTAYYTGIGRIRAATKGPAPATVIVSIAFPFDRRDVAFNEELASKTKALRELAQAFFSSRSAAELKETDETALKEELRARLNGMLLLGKIEALYFNDYLLIE